MTKAETMAKKSKEKQFDFEKDLSINKYKLDEECLSHSSIYFRYAEASIAAKAEVSKAEDNLKLVSAERNIAIRKAYTDAGAKFTEAVITSGVEKDAEVIEAKEKLRNAQEVYAKLSIAVSAMDARKSQLDNLVKLYCSGYFSVTTSSAKNNINEQTAREVRKNLNK